MKHAYSNGYGNGHVTNAMMASTDPAVVAAAIAALVGSKPLPIEDDAATALVDQCYLHLSRRQAVLWGRSRNIDDPQQRREAAEWLASQITAVAALA